MRIAREAIVPASLAAAPGLIALIAGWPVAGAVLLLLAVGVLLFFRDPRRSVPEGDGLLVSPADGKVIAIVPPTDGGATRLSIFLSLFDVHINRAPLSGRVESIQYNPGSFLPAFDHKASERNEQNRIRLSDGRHVLDVVQIAGLVARRIVCRLRPGDEVRRGQRFGLIKFGSRVDIYLPAGVELLVQVGDRVRGGSSVIGRLADERHGVAG